MRVDSFDNGTDYKDCRREHEGLLATQALGERPYDEACCKRAGLLKADGEGVDAGCMGRGVLKVVHKGIQRQDTSYGQLDTVL